MNPWLERLIELMPPPDEPVSPADDATWQAAEEALSVALPSDLKEFDRVYGKGSIYPDFGIFAPSPGGHDWYADRVRGDCDILRQVYPSGRVDAGEPQRRCASSRPRRPGVARPRTVPR